MVYKKCKEIKEMLIKRIYANCKRIKDNYCNKYDQNTKDKYNSLERFYGGLKFHLKSMYDKCDSKNYNYVTLDKLKVKYNRNVSYKNKVDVSYNDTNIVVRECNDACNTNHKWANFIHSSLKRLKIDQNFKRLHSSIYKLFFCKYCLNLDKNLDKNKGINIKHCENVLNFTYSLMPHYQHLRTLFRSISELNKNFNTINKLNYLMIQSDKNQIISYVKRLLIKKYFILLIKLVHKQ